MGREVVDKRLLESDGGRALLESYILPWEIQAMEEAARPGTPHLTSILASVRLKTGRVRDSEHVRNENGQPSNENSLDDKEGSEGIESSTPDPGNFPPGRLEEFLKAVASMRGYVSNGQLVAEWLRHWEQAGRTEEALSSLDALISRTGRYFNLEAAMDTAFEISLAIQGRSKAFPWLVRAQIANGGWKRWYSPG